MKAKLEMEEVVEMSEEGRSSKTVSMVSSDINRTSVNSRESEVRMSVVFGGRDSEKSGGDRNSIEKKDNFQNFWN